MFDPLRELNHLEWLETVPEIKRHEIPAIVAAWNAEADAGNQWSDLGWDERDELLSLGA